MRCGVYGLLTGCAITSRLQRRFPQNTQNTAPGNSVVSVPPWLTFQLISLSTIDPIPNYLTSTFPPALCALNPGAYMHCCVAMPLL